MSVCDNDRSAGTAAPFSVKEHDAKQSPRTVGDFFDCCCQPITIKTVKKLSKTIL